MRVLFVCERSAGHIFPALTWARKLKEKNEIYFFVTNPFFKSLLKKEGFFVCGKGFSFRNLIIESFFRMIEAIYLVLKFRPKKVIGFGGRDSFFLVFLASILGIKTTIYELNVKSGKANKILSYFVDTIFYGFPLDVSNKKVKFVGIPLRENIKILKKEEAKKMLNFNELPVLFCFGGSSGSSFINNIFLKLVERLNGDFQIIHLTGRRDYFKILKFYNKIEKRKFVKDFYYSIEVLYSCADIVISRAGSSTLAEIAYYKLPSILIPHRGAGGHQRENALYLKNKKAAFVFFENNFCFETFKDAVEKLLYDNNLQQKIKNNLDKIKLGVEFEKINYFDG
jgi:UDP-N-acetylglucosamine--N-acetylmuramyl-(pentapeptide) pyrophosphoryl-undecaprenol N-acetylglucosamine transferase